jgi:HAMP domain-containing protein
MSSDSEITLSQERIAQALQQAKQATRGSSVIFLVALVAILVSLAVFTAIINEQRRDAEDRAVRFEKQANDAARVLETARTAYERGDMDSVGTLLNAALRRTEILAQSVASQQPDRTPPAAAVPLEGSQQPLPQLTAARPNWNQQVYIQFAGLIAREEIRELNTALAKAGWRVEGRSGERTGNAEGLNEIRYSANANKEAAQALAEAINSSGVAGRPVVARQVDIIKPNYLEVWISRTTR